MLVCADLYRGSLHQLLHGGAAFLGSFLQWLLPSAFMVLAGCEAPRKDGPRMQQQDH